MKKFKIALLAIAIITVLLALASCGKKALTFEESYKISDEGETEGIFKVDEKYGKKHPCDDLYLNYTVGNYAMFSEYNDKRGETTYVLYSIETDEEIFKITGEIDSRSNVNLNYDNEITVVCIEEDDKYKTFLLDGNGNEIATADERIVFSDYYGDNENVYGDFFVFDGKIYYADEDGISFYCDQPAFCDLEFLEDVVVTDKYLIETNSNCIKYYNTNLELVASHTLPSYAISGDVKIFVLSNYNVFVQYCFAVDIMEDKFDFINANDDKCNLVQYIYNVEDDDTSNVKVDGYALAVANNLIIGEDYFADDIENGIIVAPIVDHHIDANACTFNVMTNKGKIKKELYSPFEVAVQIESLGDGFYFASTIGPDSQYAILDSQGNIIKIVNDSYIERCDYGFIYDYDSYFKVYDENFEEKFDSKGKNIIINHDSYIIYSEVNDDDETIYYRFDNTGESNEITTDDGEISSINSELHGIYRVNYVNDDGERESAYYTADGNVLFKRSQLSRNIYLSSDNVIFFRVYDSENDKTTYTKVTCK